MSKPLLSVVLTSYNYERYIGEALEAIVTQSYSPVEVIVIDDCSTDNSIKIIKQYADRFDYIRFVQNEKNLGLFNTLEISYNEIKGEYVYFASADDKVLPGFFEKTMELLILNPQAALCFSKPVYFNDDNPKELDIINLNMGENPLYISPKKLARDLRSTKFWIAGHTSIIKYADFLEAGKLNKDLKWYSDWFCLLVMGFRKGACFIPEPLAAMRRHEIPIHQLRKGFSKIWLLRIF